MNKTILDLHTTYSVDGSWKKGYWCQEDKVLFVIEKLNLIVVDDDIDFDSFDLRNATVVTNKKILSLYKEEFKETRINNWKIEEKTQGFFSYCWEDEDGVTQEFDTLAKAVSGAKKYTKEHSDFEINIYGMSSIYIENGKEKEW